jgi:hypothetical protein
MAMRTLEYELPADDVVDIAGADAGADAGLAEVARTADVTAIHTTNLLGALYIYARLVRLKPQGEITSGVVITSGALRLVIEGGHVSPEDARLRFDERCVQFTTPSVRDALTTLKRAGARVVDGIHVFSPDCATFSLAGREGALIEFIGRP